MKKIWNRIFNKDINNSETNNTKDKYASIVFVNRPISDYDSDIVGFESQIETIKAAINNGANMIGIVADYGAGKSSVADILSSDLLGESFYNIIKINMWDSISSQKEKKISEENISELTKSFLYQLAKGSCDNEYTSKLTSYVNKRLSKNYKSISFSTISTSLWKCLISSGIFYVLYKAFGREGVLFIEKYANNSLLGIIHLLKDINSIFLIGSILFLLFGLKSASIAFSDWKNTNEKTSDINDVFDLYDDVAKKIVDTTYCDKQIIVIEDLDRINDKELIIGFLKEIYRFQNVLDSKINGQFVFIIAIKPEAMLSGNNSTNERVYSKVFDTIVNLKTIHFEDYESVVLGMIKNDNKSKILLERLINEKIDDRLPKSFDWLLKGENLTLRDLKDRLNHALSIMVSLKNKNYKDVTSVSFESCAAVSYLESRYPIEFYRLVHEETNFAKLIIKSYTVKNNVTNASNLESEFKNIFGIKTDENGSIKERKYRDEFIKDLCILILNGVFDDDFRMYFYTYPNESYIKTTDEKDICNMIKLPNSYSDFTDLDEKMSRILSKHPKTIVFDTIKSLDLTREFPKVVIMNDKLFEVATAYGAQKSLNLLSNITLRHPLEDECESILLRLQRINIPDRQQYINLYASNVLQFFHNQNITQDDILTFRNLIIRSLKNDILQFRALFINKKGEDVLPLITKSEMELIGNIDLSLQLIDIHILTDEYKYIAEAMNENKLDEKSYYYALNVYNTLIENVDNVILSKYLIEFLIKNNKTDDYYFALIVKYLPNIYLICRHVNRLNAQELSDDYLKALDEKAISNGLNRDILVELESHDFYITYLLSKIELDELDDIDCNNERITNNILTASSRILKIDKNAFIKLRKHIIQKTQDKNSTYKKLCFDEFPLITKDELNLFTNFSDAIIHINKLNITNDNYNFIWEYCNQDERTVEECYIIFKHLLYDEDEDIVQGLFYALDFYKIKFKELDIERQEECIGYVSDALDLSETNNCIECIRHINTIVPSLENTIFEGGYSKEYIAFLNEISIYTDNTIKWLGDTHLKDALLPVFTDKLYEKGYYKNYVIGKSLFDGSLYFNLDILSINSYMEIYLYEEELYDIISNNVDFLKAATDKKLYKDITTIKHIRPFYKLPQTFDMIEHIFDIAESKEKIQYILSMNEIATKQDSISIQKFLCTDENIELLGDYKLRDKIDILLWETHKTHKKNFNIAWNKRWRKELKGKFQNFFD